MRPDPVRPKPVRRLTSQSQCSHERTASQAEGRTGWSAASSSSSVAGGSAASGAAGGPKQRPFRWAYGRCAVVPCRATVRRKVTASRRSLARGTIRQCT